MTRAMKLAIFAVVALAQLAVPAWMIGQREWVLREGTAYKFRTAPVDPYDPFRGRYVALSFEDSNGPWTGAGPSPGYELSRGGRFFAAIANGKDGFAKIVGVGPERTAAGDYLPVRAWPWTDAEKPSEMRMGVELPFDRYYMNERIAPDAERVYRARNIEAAKNSYATVRVLKGKAVIEGLFIDGEPIEEAVRRELAAP